MSKDDRHDLCETWDKSGRSCWCETGIVKALHGKTIAVAEFTGDGWGRGLTLTTTDGHRLEVSEGDLHVATDLASAARATDARS